MLDVVTFAVGNQYGNKITSDYLSKYNFHILTDNVERFPDADCKYYSLPYFNYFHKLYYPFEVAKKLKKGVFVVDDDRLHLLQNCNLKANNTNLDTFKFDGTWTNGESLDNYSNYEYWALFYSYLKHKGVDTSNVKLFLEQIFYVPYIQELTQIEDKLKEIEEIFYLLSMSKHNMHPGVCNGEGLALGYVLHTLNIKSTLFNISPNTNLI